MKPQDTQVEEAVNQFRKLDWSVPPQHIQEYLGMTKWFEEKTDWIRQTLTTAIAEARANLLSEIKTWAEEQKQTMNEKKELTEAIFGEQTLGGYNIVIEQLLSCLDEAEKEITKP